MEAQVIPLAHAVGIMEMLWHFTAKYTPQGDIGKFTDKQIAAAVGWTKRPGLTQVPAEFLPSSGLVTSELWLSSSLVRAEFLDSSPKYRLVVHDWEEHADQAVTKFLSRHGLDFVRTEDSLPLPLPTTGNPGVLLDINDPPFSTLEPDSTPEPPSKRDPIQEGIDQVAGRIHARHPNEHGRRDISVAQVEKRLAAILKHKRIALGEQEAYLQQVDRNHTAACASETWTKDGGQFAKGLDNWLAPTKERYDIAPATAEREPYRMIL